MSNEEQTEDTLEFQSWTHGKVGNGRDAHPSDKVIKIVMDKGLDLGVELSLKAQIGKIMSFTAFGGVKQEWTLLAVKRVATPFGFANELTLQREEIGTLPHDTGCVLPAIAGDRAI